MTKIVTSCGLTLPFNESADPSIILEKSTKTICIDLSAFLYVHLKPTKNIGDTILKGEIIAYDLHYPDRVYLSTASGKIVNILRGKRRKITGIIIEVEEEKNSLTNSIEVTNDKETLMKDLFEKGLSFFIHKRPFQRIIKKTDYPRSIFINAVVSAPYTPSYKHILKTNEKIFQEGINLLAKFAKVHLIYNEEEFSSFDSCSAHTAKGPHPIESPSIHITAIDPITSPKDIVWSVDVYDILSIGSLIHNGSVFSDKILSLSGGGFSKDDRILIKTSKGACIKDICPHIENIISGDPLTGCMNQDYIREKDFVITSFVKEKDNELLPFVKLGINKYTATKTYLGGFFKKNQNSKSLSYKLGGEQRPFILKDLYQKTLPLNIYIEPLIKALLAKDYPLAISLGFLDIDTNDLALSEYICPSKISLMKSFEEAKNHYLLLQEEN